MMRGFRRMSVPAILMAVSAAGAQDWISISAGPMISSVSPADSIYEERFLTPGTSVGLAVDIDAPGILGFRVSGEYFWKNSSLTGWDGEVEGFIISVMPTASFQFVRNMSLFVGAGGTFISGDYRGSNDFGDYVEATGSTAGFIFAVGTEVNLVGPLSGRLEYRHSIADLKTDNAVIDGVESSVYPAEETDLGSSQFCITFPLSILGSERSIF